MNRGKPIQNPTSKIQNGSRPKSKLRQDWERQRRRFLARFFAVSVLAVGLALYFGVWLFQPRTSERRMMTLDIPAHSNAQAIGERLEKSGVIRSGLAFRWWTRWHSEGAKFKPGRYALSSNMTLAQIAQNLDAGPQEAGIRVTIPEGYTLKQVADLMQAKSVCKADAFLQMATEEASIAGLKADFPLPKDTLEGYLFPDTYHFEPGTPVKTLIETMLMNFSTRYARPYQHEITQSGRDVHSLVTLASLIEREARVPEDRPRIAGVLENRLKRGMKLEVDATVLYALGHHKEKVYFKDLKVDSPYNTYRHKGLPPGPIANPGLPALLAATRPEANDFLYYVARPNGSHLFSQTLAEHEAAKREARKERREQGGDHG